MSESALNEARDPLTDPSRLQELATSGDGPVRDAALVHPACPNEVREASGMVFIFAVGTSRYFSALRNMMVTSQDFTRDLASGNVGVLYPGGEAEEYEVVRAAEVNGGRTDGELAGFDDGDDENLVWCGSAAPDWWSDWSLLEEFLGSDAVAALTRGDDSLFEDNQFKAAERVAFAGHEATATVWRQIRADLATVFATGERSERGSEETVPSRMSSSQELGEVADRWLREDSWRELSATAHPAVLSALARHPNTPNAVLEELAVSDQESVRWLVTRNPSARDEIRAAAVLTGVDDDNFTRELPDADWMNVRCFTLHVGVHASAWTREEFSERFPDVLDDLNSESLDMRSSDQLIDLLQDELYSWDAGIVTEFELIHG